MFDLFGLKLNYSLKYERGVNMVNLVKRRDRKSFKVDLDIPYEPSIKQIELDMLTSKDHDASFISDDLFNKSIKSQDSAFTLGHLQQ